MKILRYDISLNAYTIIVFSDLFYCNQYDYTCMPIRHDTLKFLSNNIYHSNFCLIFCVNDIEITNSPFI